MALGVLEALKAANQTSIVVGINGILPAVEQIETGGMLTTVDFNMMPVDQRACPEWDDVAR